MKYETEIRFRIDLFIYDFAGEIRFQKHIICRIERWYFYINFFEEVAVKMLEEDFPDTPKKLHNTHLITSSFVMIKVYT